MYSSALIIRFHYGLREQSKNPSNLLAYFGTGTQHLNGYNIYKLYQIISFLLDINHIISIRNVLIIYRLIHLFLGIPPITPFILLNGYKMKSINFKSINFKSINFKLINFKLINFKSPFKNIEFLTHQKSRMVFDSVFK